MKSTTEEMYVQSYEQNWLLNLCTIKKQKQQQNNHFISRAWETTNFQKKERKKKKQFANSYRQDEADVDAQRG